MGIIDKIRDLIPCVISKRTSFVTMTLLLGVFFLVEVVVGYMTNSMALIADSFHMLSDVASLIVGFLALQYSTIEAPRDVYTYGYARAEVLGALVNAVFLLALCFSIFIEALKRLVLLEEIENPVLVLIVGSIGLVVNLFGILLFHQTGHGHSHGGMLHSHSHGHSHSGNDGHSHCEHDHSQGGKGHSHGSLLIPTAKKNHSNKENKPGHDSQHGMKSHSTPLDSDVTKSFSQSLEKVSENGQPQEQQNENQKTQTLEEGENQQSIDSKIDLDRNIELTDGGSNVTLSLPVPATDQVHRNHNTYRTDSSLSSEAFNRSHIKNISGKSFLYEKTIN